MAQVQSLVMNWDPESHSVAKKKKKTDVQYMQSWNS